MRLYRTVATAIFLASIGVYTSMLPGDAFWMHYAYLLKFPPGLHRLVTSFMLTGPQLSVLFDTYFVYTYLSQLEQTKFTRKEDLIWYLMVVGSVIIVGAFSLFSRASGGLFRQPLLLAPYSKAHCAPHISARIVLLPLQL